MKDGFIFDDKPSIMDRIKKSWLGILFSVILLAILAAVTVPDFVGKTIECNKWNLGMGDLFSESCSRKFSDIIFVVGDTANTPAPALNSAFKKYLTASLKDDDSKISTISVSNPSRNPREIIAKSEIEQNDENAETIQAVEGYIAKMSATRDGADYLEAIRTASEYAEDKADTLIYVIGSGLSDSGLLNFANDQLLASSGEDYDAKTIAEQVFDAISEQNGSNSKELKGVSIIWDNIGQVTAPQPELGQDSLKKTKDIYKTLLTKLGASSILFKNGSVSDSSVRTTNTVKITKASEPVIVCKKVFTGESDIFRFQGDNANFTNRSASEEIAREMVKCAETDPGSTIHIKAYMSRGQGNCNKTALTESDKALLNSRLNAVKSLLTSIDESQIYTEMGGFGSNNECPNGTYSEIEAAKNRIVEIWVQQ